MIKKLDIINDICRKTRIYRKDPNLEEFSKRELFSLQSYLGIVLPLDQQGVGPLPSLSRPVIEPRPTRADLAEEPKRASSGGR